MTTKVSKRPARNPNGRGIYTAPIIVGLTPAQRSSVKAAAARARRSVGEWARVILTDAAVAGALR